MKEFTRIITVQVTQVKQVEDDWADDVELATMHDKENIAEQMKKTFFCADDVVADLQLFIRDVEG